MCQCTPCTHAMFEGKNIHYSSADNKPLCSFSSKICNQRRLNGYAFCVRHILEDYTAPFKRCSYVAKSSSQMCTQPIPKNEERKYCSNHMQVLGMLPKKERKQKKEKDNKNTNRETKLSFADRVKTKFNTKKTDHVSKPKTDNISVNVEDPYDPYAFSDPIAEAPCILSNSSSSSLPSPNTELVKSVPPSPGQAAPKPPSNEGTSSIAKLYPELAEKLEKIKPKAIEPKVKSRMRNSHNMKFNKLQTKIAQNRIKDKLRKSQETSHFGDGLHLMHSRSNLDVNQVTNSINNANNNNVDNMSTSDVRLPMVPPPYNGGMVPPVVTSQHLLSYKTSNHAVDLPVPLQETHGIPPPPYPGVTGGPGVPGGKPFNMPMPALVIPGNDFEKQSVMKEVPLTPAPIVPVPCPSSSFNLPPPPPYVPPKPQKRPPSPVLPVLCRKPVRVKCVLLEKEAKKRLKKDSSVKYYSYHARRKISNHILINQGICSSDEESEDEDVDMLPWQPNWFYPSSDDDNNDEELDDDFSDLRTTKLALLRSRLRRKCHQCRTATRSNSTVKKSNNQEVLALIQAAREHPPSSVTCLQEILRKQRKPVDKYKMRGLEKKRCCYRSESDVQCSNNVLPYTNHCLKHIMYNVDQQLFDYCTAKFADNTQCCVPIFDIKHELPLCHEHGAKADNYQKVQVTEVRKRPRKKTKPPALTRPPKKGKKKKKGRAVRPQKPIPPSSPIGDTSMPDAESDVTIGSETNITTATEEAVEKVHVEKVEEPVVPSTSSTVNPTNHKDNKIIDNNLGGVDLEETLGTVIDKNFELPLEQASRLLEEQDFQEVFNKIPDEAFDIFSSKNEPTAEETEELERALAAASSDIHAAKETLEQLVKGEISLDDIGEELTAILAQTLQANLQQEGNLPQATADLTSESATTLARNATYNDLGMDVSNNVPNNMAYARQVLPGHSASHANSIENTGNTLPHQVTPTQKYYPVNNGGAALSLPSQNLGTATRSYTVVPGGMSLPYQSNIPYTPLSQNITLPQQTLIGQQVPRGAIPTNTLRVTNQLISQVHHPEQGVHVLTQQVRGVAGVARQAWTAPNNQPVGYPNTNGYPSPRNQFAQNVSATNQIGKFAVSAQSNTAASTSEVGNVVNKVDTLYSQLNHSVNLSDVAVAGSSGQGFTHHPRNTNFSSFTSNTGS